ncbi:hypothetical protein SH668x_001991 [Planctomicrobium sp. SH668]|uniref:hypothetical protein n=1 Tax=Planctomicrobium sp. SH668 TaxID=3448126 RepID=UPI003F5B0656
MTRFRTWKFDDRSGLLSLLLIMGFLFPGCWARGNSELLESQLRSQESHLRRYENEVSQLKSSLALTQRELDLLRSDHAAQGGVLSAEEVSRALAQTQGIVFNTLLTAGQDHDEQNGDERFHAVFYPHDDRGDLVKLFGRIEFEALDISLPADQKVIGHWVYETEDARKLWYTGFMTSGFQIEESWQRQPIGSKILLIAKLQTIDGRKFEANHTISVVPPSNSVSSPLELPQVINMKDVSDAAGASKSVPVRSAGFVSDDGTRLVPPPDAWEFEAKPEAQKPGRSTLEDSGKAQLPNASTEASEAPPFPPMLDTSDNWMEESIPVLR